MVRGEEWTARSWLLRDDPKGWLAQQEVTARAEGCTTLVALRRKVDCGKADYGESGGVHNRRARVKGGGGSGCRQIAKLKCTWRAAFKFPIFKYRKCLTIFRLFFRTLQRLVFVVFFFCFDPAPGTLKAPAK